MRIETVTVDELDAFATRALARPGTGVVPVSRHRAAAWSRNPHAHPQDVALLVAYDGPRCIGYLGLLPSRLQIGDRLEEMSWFSTFYVDPAARGTGAGALLAMRAVSLGRDLAVTFFSAEAARLYQALRFRPLGPLRFLYADLCRLDPVSLPLRIARRLDRGPRKRWNHAVGALGMPAKRLIYALLVPRARAALRNVEARPIERVSSGFDKEPLGSVQARFYRGAEVVNWMLEWPWVVQGAEHATPGYYFEDWRSLFALRAYALHERASKRLLGQVVLRVEGHEGTRRVTVLDHAFGAEEHERLVVPLAVLEGARIAADELRLPLAMSSKLASAGLPRRLFRESESPCLYRPGRPQSPLERVCDTIELRLTDGDRAFA